jgi:hypothetical protein
LLKLYVYQGNEWHWQLLIDGTLLFDGGTVTTTDGDGLTREEFPDRCVVAGPGETLQMRNTSNTYGMRIQVIGYFYDVP